MLKNTGQTHLIFFFFFKIGVKVYIFLLPPEIYLHWTSNAMLDRPVACQVTRLEQFKILPKKKTVDGGLRLTLKIYYGHPNKLSDNYTCSHFLPWVFRQENL